MQSKFQTWAEWPTLLLLGATYVLFFGSAVYVYEISVVAGCFGMVLGAVLHSSLTHEMLHGHPFRSCFWNAALVFPALSVFIPYLRFKDTHLAHHKDERLTDPYDDPETNFLDPSVWRRLPKTMQKVLRFNNTLCGRIFIGPVISQFCFVLADLRSMIRGDRRVWLGWMLHVPSVLCVAIALTYFSNVSLFTWVMCAYVALSILKIRTYLEHRAYDDFRGRTVVIADRGILALLFLNNNFHAVHHKFPKLSWFELPAVFQRQKNAVLSENHGYYYPSYRQIFSTYFFKAKDQVAHPLWSGDEISDNAK